MKILTNLVLCGLFTYAIASSQPLRFEPRGMGGGSEFHSLTISPSAPFTLRVAGSSSQMFSSADFGTTWSTIPYGTLAGGGFAGRITFTTNPMIQYAISYKDGYHIPVRSSDAGRTWTPINDPTFGGAYSIHADPESTNRLILSDYTDVYYSYDSGANWTIAFSELTDGADGCHIAGVLFDGPYIMVATQAGIYTSDDDGFTFLKDSFYDVPNNSGIISFHYASSGNLFRLVCLTGPMDMLYPGVEADEITTVDDLFVMDVINGVSGDWISKKSALPQDFAPNLCAMAINDPSRIYLAGTNASSEPMIMRSTNGGSTFQSMFKTANNQNITTGWIGEGSSWDWNYANTPLTLAIAQKNSQAIAFGDYATLHVSGDGGDSWRQAYTGFPKQQSPGTQVPKNSFYESNGLENTTIHDIMHVDSMVMLSGLDMGGIIRSTDKGKTWTKCLLPTTFETCYALEQSGTNVYAAVSILSSLYSIEKVSDSIIDNSPSKLLRSTDKGATWSIIQEFPSTISTLCIDPQNPNLMYAGIAHSKQGGILVNDKVNGNGNWKALSNPPRTEGHPHSIIVLKDGTIISSFTARRSGSTLTQSAGVFSSTDGGISWKDHSIEAMKTWTTSISIDPHDPYRNTWYACTWSNPMNLQDNSGGVYRTLDRGSTWTRILTLPKKEDYSGRVNACVINPVQSSQMFVATASHGLYFSENIQQPSPSFVELSQIFPAKASRTFLFHPLVPWEMFIGTDGNGLRFGTNAMSQIPVLTNIFPERDTLIKYKKGERPSLSIIVQRNSRQTLTKAQARFSKTRTFLIADTTDIMNPIANHLPANTMGGDEILYMQSRIGNNAGWSSWSEMTAIRFSELQQGQVPSIIVIRPSNDTVLTYPKGEKPSLVISWQVQAKDSILQSQVRFSPHLAFSPKADTVNAGLATSINLPQFIPGNDSVWYMQIRSLNMYGWSAWSAIRTLTFREQQLSSIDDALISYGIFPHPIEDILHIHHQELKSYDIITINGASIMSGMTNTPLNVSFLPKGIYMLRFKNDEHMIRFIKQ